MQSMPVEIEKLLLRSDFSGHFAHNMASTLTPLIERHVKEAIAKTFIPVYSQQSTAIHQELLREMRAELHGVKTELTAWHSELARNHDVRFSVLPLHFRWIDEFSYRLLSEI